MFQAQTVNLNHYKGTPEGMLRLGFTMPDGNNRSGFIRGVGADWDTSLFVDESTETMFFVSTSPDKRGLVVERWLNFHAPKRKEYTTKTAQKEDLGNKDAGTLTHEEIVEKLKDTITEGDKPKPAEKAPLKLTALIENTTKVVEKKGTKGKYKGKVISRSRKVETRGDYEYSTGNYGKGKDNKERMKPGWRCRTQRGVTLMATKGDPSWTRSVFRNENGTEIFFLFTKPDGSYLLESIRQTRTSYQRREATAAKGSVSGTPEKIVEAMEPSLTYDPNAFA